MTLPRFRLDRRRSDTVAAYLFMSPWLVGAVFLILIPLLFSVWLSVSDWGVGRQPEYVGLANFETIFTDDYRFWLSLRVTLTYVVISVPVYLVFGLGTAVLLNQRVWGVRAFR